MTVLFGLVWLVLLVVGLLAWIPRVGSSILDKIGWRRLPRVGQLSGFAASGVLLFGSCVSLVIAASSSSQSAPPSSSTPPTVAAGSASSRSVGPAPTTGAPNVVATPAPTVAPPAATQAPTVAPTPAPTPAPPAHTVSLTVTTPVGRNQDATASATTTAGSNCTITVTYNSGPSTAQGLEPKTASAAGAVSWTWRVGGNTALGTYPVDVRCTSPLGQVATQRVMFTVQ